MATETGRTARRRLGGRALAIVIIAAFVLVYAAVVALYALSDDSDAVGCRPPSPTDAVRYSIEPTAVDAVGNRMRATVSVDTFGPVADGSGFPDQNLTMLITGTDGQQAYEYLAGKVPPSYPVAFLTNGEVAQWPFDSYTAQFTVLTAEGALPGGSVVPTVLCGTAQVAGWDITSEEVEGDDTLVVDDEPVEQIQLRAVRSPATITFGIVILALMVTLPILGLTVSIRMLLGRRKTEATLMSWIAAMLFATLPLRGFLPGSPPIGSWVDYLVVLWAVVGLVASLVIAALAWTRWAAPGERPSAAPVPVPILVPVAASGAAASGAAASGVAASGAAASGAAASGAGGSGVAVEEGVDLPVVDAGEGAPGEW